MSKFDDATDMALLDRQKMAASGVQNAQLVGDLGIDIDEWDAFRAEMLPQLCRASGIPVDMAVALVPVVSEAMNLALQVGIEYGRLTADTEVPR